MACFLVVATLRAAVRNSLRSWLKVEPLPLLGVEGREFRLGSDFPFPFPPADEVPFPGGRVLLVEFEVTLAGIASVASVVEEPFVCAG